MNIREKLLMESNKEILQRFDYYKAIGCSDNQSLVLSLYTYGRVNSFCSSLKSSEFILL